jgi:hypothetical protein
MTLLVVMLLHNNNKLVDSCYVVILIESRYAISCHLIYLYMIKCKYVNHIHVNAMKTVITVCR